MSTYNNSDYYVVRISTPSFTETTYQHDIVVYSKTRLSVVYLHKLN